MLGKVSGFQVLWKTQTSQGNFPHEKLSADGSHPFLATQLCRDPVPMGFLSGRFLEVNHVFFQTICVVVPIHIQTSLEESFFRHFVSKENEAKFF